VIAGTALLLIAIILAIHTHLWIPVPVSTMAALLLFVAPKKYCFPLVMALASTDVVILVSRISL